MRIGAARERGQSRTKTRRIEHLSTCYRFVGGRVDIHPLFTHMMDGVE